MFDHDWGPSSGPEIGAKNVRRSRTDDHARPKAHSSARMTVRLHGHRACDTRPSPIERRAEPPELAAARPVGSPGRSSGARKTILANDAQRRPQLAKCGVFSELMGAVGDGAEGLRFGQRVRVRVSWSPALGLTGRVAGGVSPPGYSTPWEARPAHAGPAYAASSPELSSHSPTALTRFCRIASAPPRPITSSRTPGPNFYQISARRLVI